MAVGEQHAATACSRVLRQAIRQGSQRLHRFSDSRDEPDPPPRSRSTKFGERHQRRLGILELAAGLDAQPLQIDGSGAASTGDDSLLNAGDRHPLCFGIAKGAHRTRTPAGIR